jgi:ketosteroid isomerase-like protein
MNMMTTTDQAHKIGADLAAAISSNDPERVTQLYSSDAVIWHNTDGLEIGLDQLAEIVGAIAGVATASVEVVDQLATPSGLVQVQRNTYSMNDGGETSFLAALIIRLNDAGEIVRLDEFLDSVPLSPLFEAIGSAQNPE